MDVYARIAIITLGAAVLVGVLRRLGQSAIVAYLVLGMLVGPSVCRILRADHSIQHLAETGGTELVGPARELAPGTFYRPAGAE